MINKMIHNVIGLALVGSALGLVGCSNGLPAEYASVETYLKASRIPGTNAGDYNPGKRLGNQSVISEANAEGATVEAPKVDVPPMESADSEDGLRQKPGGVVPPTSVAGGRGEPPPPIPPNPVAGGSIKLPSPTPTAPQMPTQPPASGDPLDRSMLGSCMSALDSDEKFPSYRVVSVSNKNANNTVLYSDPSTSKPGLVLIRVGLQNANKSEIRLMNPKSVYCIDLRTNNANNFKIQIACEAKVGIVSVVRRNPKGLGVNVSRIRCSD